MRSWVIGAIGQIGDRSSIPMLERLLDAKELRVRHAAVYALGVLGEENALPALRHAHRRERRQASYLFVGRPVFRKAFDRIRSAAERSPETRSE